MDVIPVIDLKNGVVVRARMGQRDQYRPIESPLSPTSDPVEVARGLLSVHAFATLYVADLDAIGGSGDNGAEIARLKMEFPSLQLWVDNGAHCAAAAAGWLALQLGHLVLGSEAQTSTQLLRSLSSNPRVVLSLDFHGDTFQGPPDMLSDTAVWPRRLIVMTLGRVGSRAGPDLNKLHAIRAVARWRDVYAAGGVRDLGDLLALKRDGLAGALVASSLHDGRLTGPDIARL